MKDKSNEVVNIIDVTFAYNGRPVLENVNLAVNRGDFLALIGANGAAKSTLMKLMVGLLKPKTGKVMIFNQDLKGFNQWNRIGYVSQQAAQINTAFPATVEEIVGTGLYGGLGHFIRREEKREAVQQALKLVGMEDLSRRLIGQLSGGQRQKVFVAKALVKNPEVLFLDEPTTGIDASSQQEFYDILMRLNEEEGITIVMVTHDIGNIFHKAGKIGCIRDKGAYIHETLDEVTEEHIAETLGYRILHGVKEHKLEVRQ
ncbi:MAG: metal ABC transporter ATP-binding protein [Tissierellaceae bacterium]|nr:metal ABC transporter ATP-binding protein [Tissierellaceae bacterium]